MNSFLVHSCKSFIGCWREKSVPPNFVRGFFGFFSPSHDVLEVEYSSRGKKPQVASSFI